MALRGNIGIDVRARNFREDIVQQARAAEKGIKPINIRLNDKGFRQPLGRITGDMAEFQKSLDASVARTLAFGAAVGVLSGVSRGFKAMVVSAIEVEKSLKDINVILQLSGSNLKKFSADLFEVAKNTGQTFENVAVAATELARQGLGAEESLKRINAAMILTRLSGMDSARSVETLTAALNGFKKAALDAETVVNRLANVDAAFAVSTNDLSDALSRASSTAQAAKVSFNELLAAVTSVQQQTARGGAVIGNAFKSIFTRIQRASVREQLEAIGVATTTVAGKFRSAMDILKDYSKVYDSLSDGQQAYTDQLIAGVFQINNLRALIIDLKGDYSIYNRALNTANDTTNEAIQRNKELNKTTSALLAETAASAKKLGAELASILAMPAIKKVLDIFNKVAETISTALDPQKGNSLVKAFFGAIGDFIAGPGLLIIAGAFIKLFQFIAVQTGSAVKEVFKINSSVQKTQEIERKITGILGANNNLYAKIMANTGNTAKQEKILLQYLKQETLELQKQQQMVASMARSRGVRVGLKGPKGRAEGFIPNYANGLEGAIASERKAIAAGTGGASKEAKPKVLKNFPVGGGRKETVVANTDEVIVPRYKGSTGSAIFNKDMVEGGGGMPSGARKVSAVMGLIPNFVGLGRAPLTLTTGMGRRGSAVAMRASAVSAGIGKRAIPSAVGQAEEHIYALLNKAKQYELSSLSVNQMSAFIPNKFVKQATASYNSSNGLTGKQAITDNDVLTGTLKQIAQGDRNKVRGDIMEDALNRFSKTPEGADYFQGQVFSTGAAGRGGGAANQYAADAVAEKLALEVKSGEYTNFAVLMKNFRVPGGLPLVNNLAREIKTSKGFKNLSPAQQKEESAIIDDLVAKHKTQVRAETEKVFDEMAARDPAFAQKLQELGYYKPGGRNDVMSLLTGGAAGGFVPNFLGPGLISRITGGRLGNTARNVTQSVRGGFGKLIGQPDRQSALEQVKLPIGRRRSTLLAADEKADDLIDLYQQRHQFKNNTPPPEYEGFLDALVNKGWGNRDSIMKLFNRQSERGGKIVNSEVRDALKGENSFSELGAKPDGRAAWDFFKTSRTTGSSVLVQREAAQRGRANAELGRSVQKRAVKELEELGGTATLSTGRSPPVDAKLDAVAQETLRELTGGKITVRNVDFASSLGAHKVEHLRNKIFREAGQSNLEGLKEALLARGREFNGPSLIGGLAEVGPGLAKGEILTRDLTQTGKRIYTPPPAGKGFLDGHGSTETWHRELTAWYKGLPPGDRDRVRAKVMTGEVPYVGYARGFIPNLALRLPHRLTRRERSMQFKGEEMGAHGLKAGGGKGPASSEERFRASMEDVGQQSFIRKPPVVPKDSIFKKMKVGFASTYVNFRKKWVKWTRATQEGAAQALAMPWKKLNALSARGWEKVKGMFNKKVSRGKWTAGGPLGAIAKKTKGKARGFIPNYARKTGALQDAIVREETALKDQGSKAKIYIDQDSRLKGGKNPQGLLVANTRDEPSGGSQGVNRALKEGADPRAYGAVKGFVPNYAEFNNPAFSPPAFRDEAWEKVKRLHDEGSFAAAQAKASANDLDYDPNRKVQTMIPKKGGMYDPDTPGTSMNKWLERRKAKEPAAKDTRTGGKGSSDSRTQEAHDKATRQRLSTVPLESDQPAPTATGITTGPKAIPSGQLEIGPKGEFRTPKEAKDPKAQKPQAGSRKGVGLRSLTIEQREEFTRRMASLKPEPAPQTISRKLQAGPATVYGAGTGAETVSALDYERLPRPSEAELAKPAPGGPSRKKIFDPATKVQTPIRGGDMPGKVRDALETTRQEGIAATQRAADEAAAIEKHLSDFNKPKMRDEYGRGSGGRTFDEKARRIEHRPGALKAIEGGGARGGGLGPRGLSPGGRPLIAGPAPASTARAATTAAESAAQQLQQQKAMQFEQALNKAYGKTGVEKMKAPSKGSFGAAMKMDVDTASQFRQTERFQEMSGRERGKFHAGRGAAGLKRGISKLGGNIGGMGGMGLMMGGQMMQQAAAQRGEVSKPAEGFSGAGMGAMVGMMLGPKGAIAGAVIGGVYGILTAAEKEYEMEVNKTIAARQKEIAAMAQQINSMDQFGQAAAQFGDSLKSGDAETVTKSMERLSDAMGQMAGAGLEGADIGSMLASLDDMEELGKKVEEATKKLKVKQSLAAINSEFDAAFLLMGKDAKKGEKAVEAASKNAATALGGIIDVERTKKNAAAINNLSASSAEDIETMMQMMGLNIEMLDPKIRASAEAMAKFGAELKKQAQTRVVTQKIAEAFARLNKNAKPLTQTLKGIGTTLVNEIKSIETAFNAASKIFGGFAQTVLAESEAISTVGIGEKERFTTGITREQGQAAAGLEIESLIREFQGERAEATELAPTLKESGDFGAFVKDLGNQLDKGEDFNIVAATISAINKKGFDKLSDDEKTLIDQIKAVNNNLVAQEAILSAQLEQAKRQRFAETLKGIRQAEIMTGDRVKALGDGFVMATVAAQSGRTSIGGADLEGSALRSIVGVIENFAPPDDSGLLQLQSQLETAHEVENFGRVIAGITQDTSLLGKTFGSSEEALTYFQKRLEDALMGGELKGAQQTSGEAVLRTMQGRTKLREEQGGMTPKQLRDAAFEGMRAAMGGAGFDMGGGGDNLLALSTEIGKGDAAIVTGLSAILGVESEMLSLMRSDVGVKEGVDKANDISEKNADAQEKTGIDLQALKDEVANIMKAAGSDMGKALVAVIESKIVADAGKGQAGGFIPNFAESPVSRALKFESSMGGRNPTVDYHPRVGTYVRDAATQKNFGAVLRDHPEGMASAVKNSKALQGVSSGAAGGHVPAFVPPLIAPGVWATTKLIAWYTAYAAAAAGIGYAAGTTNWSPTEEKHMEEAVKIITKWRESVGSTKAAAKGGGGLITKDTTQEAREMLMEAGWGRNAPGSFTPGRSGRASYRHRLGAERLSFYDTQEGSGLDANIKGSVAERESLPIASEGDVGTQGNIMQAIRKAPSLFSGLAGQAMLESPAMEGPLEKLATQVYPNFKDKGALFGQGLEQIKSVSPGGQLEFGFLNQPTLYSQAGLEKIKTDMVGADVMLTDIIPPDTEALKRQLYQKGLETLRQRLQKQIDKKGRLAEVATPLLKKFPAGDVKAFENNLKNPEIMASLKLADSEGAKRAAAWPQHVESKIRQANEKFADSSMAKDFGDHQITKLQNLAKMQEMLGRLEGNEPSWLKEPFLPKTSGPPQMVQYKTNLARFAGEDGAAGDELYKALVEVYKKNTTQLTTDFDEFGTFGDTMDKNVGALTPFPDNTLTGEGPQIDAYAAAYKNKVNSLKTGLSGPLELIRDFDEDLFGNMMDGGPSEVKEWKEKINVGAKPLKMWWMKHMMDDDFLEDAIRDDKAGVWPKSIDQVYKEDSDLYEGLDVRAKEGAVAYATKWKEEAVEEQKKIKTKYFEALGANNGRGQGDKSIGPQVDAVLKLAGNSGSKGGAGGGVDSILNALALNYDAQLGLEGEDSMLQQLKAAIDLSAQEQEKWLGEEVMKEGTSEWRTAALIAQIADTQGVGESRKKTAGAPVVVPQKPGEDVAAKVTERAITARNSHYAMIEKSLRGKFPEPGMAIDIDQGYKDFLAKKGVQDVDRELMYGALGYSLTLDEKNPMSFKAQLRKAYGLDEAGGRKNNARISKLRAAYDMVKTKHIMIPIATKAGHDTIKDKEGKDKKIPGVFSIMESTPVVDEKVRGSIDEYFNKVQATEPKKALTAAERKAQRKENIANRKIRNQDLAKVRSGEMTKEAYCSKWTQLGFPDKIFCKEKAKDRPRFGKMQQKAIDERPKTRQALMDAISENAKVFLGQAKGGPAKVYEGRAKDIVDEEGFRLQKRGYFNLSSEEQAFEKLIALSQSNSGITTWLDTLTEDERKTVRGKYVKNAGLDAYKPEIMGGDAFVDAMRAGLFGEAERLAPMGTDEAVATRERALAYLGATRGASSVDAARQAASTVTLDPAGSAEDMEKIIGAKFKTEDYDANFSGNDIRQKVQANFQGVEPDAGNVDAADWLDPNVKEKEAQAVAGIALPPLPEAVGPIANLWNSMQKIYDEFDIYKKVLEERADMWIWSHLKERPSDGFQTLDLFARNIQDTWQNRLGTMGSMEEGADWAKAGPYSLPLVQRAITSKEFEQEIEVGGERVTEKGMAAEIGPSRGAEVHPWDPILDLLNAGHSWDVKDPLDIDAFGRTYGSFREDQLNMQGLQQQLDPSVFEEWMANNGLTGETMQGSIDYIKNLVGTGGEHLSAFWSQLVGAVGGGTAASGFIPNFGKGDVRELAQETATDMDKLKTDIDLNFGDMVVKAKRLAKESSYNLYDDPGQTGVRGAAGFIPHFAGAAAEMAAASKAGYKSPVRSSQVKNINIPGVGSTTYNTQETVKRHPGVRQPFIVPPRDSRVAKSYSGAVQSKFGFDPYKPANAGGFVPNLQAGGDTRLEEAADAQLVVAHLFKGALDMLNTTTKLLSDSSNNLKLSASSMQKSSKEFSEALSGLGGGAGATTKIEVEPVTLATTEVSLVAGNVPEKISEGVGNTIIESITSAFSGIKPTIEGKLSLGELNITLPDVISNVRTAIEAAIQAQLTPDSPTMRKFTTALEEHIKPLITKVLTG